MKYFVYCRKSTEGEDRQILSLPAQKRELQDLARKHKLEIVEIFSEAASAYKLGRPQFNEMLRRLQEGEADAILTWTYSRLARNALDGAMLIHSLDEGIIKEIRTPGGYCDGSGNSKFMLQLEFAMSKKTSDDNSEAVIRGNKEKILRGWDIRRHAGYRFVEEPLTGEKIIDTDPERFDLVKNALHLILQHRSVTEVLEILNTQWGYRTPKTRKLGGKPMSLSNFYKILHEEFYCGWIYTADGERIKAKHVPMITEAEYWNIQEILGKKGKPRPKWLELPYRGLIKCGECDCSVCMEEKIQCICSACKTKFASKNRTDCPECGLSIDKMNNPTHLHYVYGRCTKKKVNIKCSQKTIKIEELEHILSEYLLGLNLSPRVTEWVLKQLEKQNATQFQTNSQVRQNLERNIEEIQKQLDSLLASFTSPSNAAHELITPDEYKEHKRKLITSKAKIQEQLTDSLAQSDTWMETAEGAFDFARTAYTRFNTGDYKTRTEIIKQLGLNLTLKDRKITIDQPQPWLFMYKANQKLAELKNRRLEPEKSIDNYDKTGIVDEVISTLQGWRESNSRQGFWRPLFYH